LLVVSIVTAWKNPLFDLFVLLFLCIIMHCHLACFLKKIIFLKNYLLFWLVWFYNNLPILRFILVKLKTIIKKCLVCGDSCFK
jgi:hypothetical protein